MDNLKREFLERFRFGMSRAFYRQDLRDLEPSIFTADLEDAGEQMIVKLSATILGETLQKIEVRYPADWRQAFKARWFPRWALRRWPIEYVIRTMEVQAVYPSLRHPDCKPYLIPFLDGEIQRP